MDIKQYMQQLGQQARAAARVLAAADSGAKNRALAAIAEAVDVPEPAGTDAARVPELDGVRLEAFAPAAPTADKAPSARVSPAPPVATSAIAAPATPPRSRVPEAIWLAAT